MSLPWEVGRLEASGGGSWSVTVDRWRGPALFWAAAGRVGWGFSSTEYINSLRSAGDFGREWEDGSGDGGIGGGLVCALKRIV